MASGSSLPTIWRLPDELWAILAAVFAEYDPPSRMGLPRIDQRKACDGIIYRLRTGCQWNALPAEFGDDINVYRTFRRWESKGISDKLWAVLLYSCDALGGVDWQWQAADGCLGKARGIPKKGRKSNASARTRLTSPRRASRKAYLAFPIARSACSVRQISRMLSRHGQTRVCLALVPPTS